MASNAFESELMSEVIAVCNDLGHKNKSLDNKYILNRKDGNNDLKDLIRFVRNDDKQTFLVRKQLGFANIVDNDLIPIVEQYSLEDIPLFDKVLRLLVDLTNPSILQFRSGKAPEDKMESQKFLELQSFLYTYKLSFGSHKKFWTVLAKHLTRILELDEEKRQIEDTLMFERILILIRNVLHIPIDNYSEQMVAEEDTNPHDRILEVMHSSGINDLILLLCNDESHQEFCFHLIEIISLMFREQNAEFIAKSVANYQQNSGQNRDRRSDFEREIDRKELKELKARDKSKSIQNMSKFSRFNGTYVIKNMKSISDREMICNKTPEDLTQIGFDLNKDIKRKAKNRRPMADNTTNKTSFGTKVVHKSTPFVRKILFDFCTDFLQNSYNQFMREIQHNLSRNMSQENDETYYLWAIQFFMEFNRSNPKANDNTLCSETTSMTTFHFLQTQIEKCLELIKQQKHEMTLWSKRLHFGLKAYRELLFSLNYFYYLKDDGIRRKAKQIQRDLFYEVEYRDLLMTLLHEYNEVKMSKDFLKDLIETNHVFLKMLENYYKNNSRLLVKEKVRKVRKKKPKKKAEDKTPPEEVWNEIVALVSEALQGSVDLPSPEEVSAVRAFDPTSEKTNDEQKMDVLRRVHHFLKQKLVVEAIALYRDARNCWTGDEDNAFGSQDILPEEELLSLNEVLMTEFPKEPTVEEQEEEEIEEEIETETNPKTREREVELNEVINKYCHPNVIQNFALLLRTYDTNSAETNHCIIKMLHRIAFDCKMHAMLFQASVFRTFQRILSDSSLQSTTAKEVSKFAKFIVSKFVSVAQNNSKVFMELLFWKNCREATELEDGYEREGINKKVAKQLWTEEQELELKVLYEEYKDKTEGEKDYIDLILEHMIDETKTRRQLIRQLKQQGIYTKTKSKSKSKNAKKRTKEKKNQKEFGDDNSSGASDGSDNEENNEVVVNYMSDEEINERVETMEKKRSLEGEDDEELAVTSKRARVMNGLDDEELDVLKETPLPDALDEPEVMTTPKKTPLPEDSDDEEVVVKSKNRHILEDSDDEEMAVMSKTPLVEDSDEEELVVKSKRTRVMDSSDDEEPDIPKKTSVLQDSDDDEEVIKSKKTPLVEDSDDEEPVVKSKKRRVVTLDDDSSD